MADDQTATEYVVEVVYEDAGMGLQFDMDTWRDRIEEDFSSFERIKQFFRVTTEDYQDHVRENAKVSEDEGDSSIESSLITVKNAPVEWQEDPGKAAAHVYQGERYMVRLAIVHQMEKELETQRDLLENQRFKTMILRQSAFFEAFLELENQLKFQHQKGEPLSDNEMRVIENMGHRDRIRLAHLLGTLSEEDHGYLQSMSSLRNSLAHTPWNELDEDLQRNVRDTARKVYELLKNEVERGTHQLENAGADTKNHEGIGFSAASNDVQRLQLEVLDAILEAGGKIEQEKLLDILVWDDERAEQRLIRMDEIGYLKLNLDAEEVSIKSKGRELLRDELQE